MKTSCKKPLIIVFAGPNGSGKSTITEYVDIHDCVFLKVVTMFLKRKDKTYKWTNDDWDEKRINQLTEK